MSATPSSLGEWLGEAQVRGLIGPDELPRAIGHAQHLGQLAREWTFPGEHHLDLGSGGGLPGLVLAAEWTTSAWTLLDASRRATDFLGEAVGGLGMADRVKVVWSRAEDAATDRRATHGLVTARSVGRPALTAEYAAPFLMAGGLLVVSEPPDGGERWPAGPLAELGLTLEALAEVPVRAAAIRMEEKGCPDRFPRRPGVAAKRPLW